jgi:peptidoglycan/LPS O-acetylase OafA/YrhL
MKRIPVLDGVRAAAILCVLASHAFNGPGWLSLWSAPGSFGVSMFMTLSGYLITNVMLADEQLAGRLRLRRFYWRRAARILPALYVYLAVIAVLGAAAIVPAPAWEGWLAGAFYVRNVIGGEQQITEHLWSLGLEEQFYLAWPVLFILTRRLRLAFMLSAVVATTALRFLWQNGHAAWLVLGNGFNPGHVPVFHPLLRMDTFLIGGMFAVCRPKWVSAIPIFPLGLASVVWYFLANGSVLHLPVGAFLMATVISALVERPASLEARLLSAPCLVAIGTVSYSLYLWQQLFLVEDVRALHWWTFPAVAGVATASYWVVERPALRWKDRSRILQTGNQAMEQPGIQFPIQIRNRSSHYV